MKKYFYRYIFVFAVLVSVFSCGTVKNTEPTRIGLLSLDNYGCTQNSFSADTLYKVVQNDAVFNREFRSEIGASQRRPAFNGQMVVAILIKSGETALRFERAEIVGSTVNVYARNCPKPDCDNMLTPLTCMATIPKVSSARSVQFFINGESKNRVML